MHLGHMTTSPFTNNIPHDFSDPIYPSVYSYKIHILLNKSNLIDIYFLHIEIVQKQR